MFAARPWQQAQRGGAPCGALLQRGGTVALAGGTVTFTPEANYDGPAAFDYTVSDGSLVDVGTVAVTVTPLVTITV